MGHKKTYIIVINWINFIRISHHRPRRNKTASLLPSKVIQLCKIQTNAHASLCTVYVHLYTFFQYISTHIYSHKHRYIFRNILGLNSSTAGAQSACGPSIPPSQCVVFECSQPFDERRCSCRHLCVVAQPASSVQTPHLAIGFYVDLHWPQ